MPTIFLSAATIDLQPWRDVLHGAFSRAGFRVLTQNHSLGAAPGDVKRLLTDHIDESDCVIHLAGIGYGWDAQDPFPEAPEFVCSWTQFEYYYAHQTGKDVIAFVCAPDLSKTDFDEEGNVRVRARKKRLQAAHRQRVESGKFNGTPLAHRVKRTANESVESVPTLLQAVAAAVGRLHKLGPASQAAQQELTRQIGLHQLPPLPPVFVGRVDDLQELRSRDPAGGAHITGLRGMGGIGKTALAVVLAHEWLDRFPDAQLFLDARGTQAHPPTAAALLARVIQTFHPEAKLPEDEAPLRGIYHDVLAQRRVLILLDNAADARQATPLIPPAGCGLIVTSRNNFLLGKTAAYLVGRLADLEAVELLREYYRALSDADAAELIRLCAGLPLALRLAGAHLALDASDRNGVPNVAGYITALRSGRLKTLDRDAPDAAEVTISETLRLSEDQLAPDDRDAWRKLGIFTASFDARAAAAIAGADESLLGRFVRRSLLEREESDRYKLHDLAADYARGALDAETLYATRLTHARHYTTVGAETDDLYLAGDAVGGLKLFDQERPQLEAAFAWLVEQRDTATDRGLIDLVNGVAYTSNLRFHPRQQIVWLEAQRDAARRLGDRSHEGNALGNLGNAYRHLGDARQAIEFYEQRLVIAREIGDRRGEGNALGGLGIAHAVLGDARLAIEFFEQCLVIAREIGDRRGEGNTLGNLGNAHDSLGDARRAIEYHEQCLIIAREIGDRRGEGNALGGLGIAHDSLGDARRAIEYHEQALVISREIGDRRGEAADLGNLGLAHDSLGDARRAIEFYEQILAIAREIGDRRGEGNALGNLGNAHYSLGDARRAIEFCEQQLVIVREIGDRRGEGTALYNSALSLWKLGNRAAALTRAEAALQIHEAIEDPWTPKVRQTLDKWRNTAE